MDDRVISNTTSRMISRGLSGKNCLGGNQMYTHLASIVLIHEMLREGGGGGGHVSCSLLFPWVSTPVSLPQDKTLVRAMGERTVEIYLQSPM